jgi:hypothetical protein
LSEGFNPYPHTHRALSAIQSWLVNKNLPPVANLIDTGTKLTNQHQLSPAHESLVATPTHSNFNNTTTMPTRSKEAEIQQKKEEEAMAVATLQQEK